MKIFWNLRIKPDVFVRCRRSGVQVMYTILSTLQTHKIGKFDVPKAISMMLVMREMDKVKTHLDAYCISSISFASKRDKHFYTWFFVLIKSFQHLNDCIWLPFSTIWNTLDTFWYRYSQWCKCSIYRCYISSYTAGVKVTKE